MSILNRNLNGDIILCCGGKGCPTLNVEGDSVNIKDDHGGEIKISIGEAKLIKQAIDQARDADTPSSDSPVV